MNGSGLDLKSKMPQVLHGHRVILTINKNVIFCLVLNDPELTVDVIPELVIISVQMVFRNIGQYGDVGPERMDIVQLKTADLSHVQRLGGPRLPVWRKE